MDAARKRHGETTKQETKHGKQGTKQEPKHETKQVTKEEPKQAPRQEPKHETKQETKKEVTGIQKTSAASPKSTEAPAESKTKASSVSESEPKKSEMQIASKPAASRGDIHEPTEPGPGNVVVVDNAPGCDIITRVANIPLVSSTLGQVNNVYTWTKESSTLANKAFGLAEKSVAVAAQTAKPVVDRFEKPISMASDFACHQLDKLEEKVPLICKPTDEVVSTIQDGTRQVIEDTKQKGMDGLNILMNTRVGKVVTFGLDTMLGVSEFAVEYYLPPDETEKQPEAKEDYEGDMNAEKEPTPSSVQRVGTLTNKLRHRIHKRALKNIRYAQKRSQETIEKLNFTVNLIDYAKNSIDGANQAIRTNTEAAQEKLWNTWNDWTTVAEGECQEDAEVKDKDGEQRTLAIARQLAKRLRNLTHNIAGSISHLPQHLRTTVDETKTLADSLYHSFEEARYFSDVSSAVLNSCREQLSKLSHASMQVADYVINSPPIQWMVPNEFPNMEIEEVEMEYIPGSDQNDVDLTSDSES